MPPGLGGGGEAAAEAAASAVAVQLLERQTAESRGGPKLAAPAQAATVPSGCAILRRQRLTAEHSPAMELLAAYSGLATKAQLPQALAVVEAFLAASRYDVLDRWASQLHIQRACHEALSAAGSTGAAADHERCMPCRLAIEADRHMRGLSAVGQDAFLVP